MEGKSKRQSQKSLFVRQYVNLQHLLCKGPSYFTFISNFYNKGNVVASHGMLTFIWTHIWLFPLTPFVSCQPLWRSWWSKLKGIQFLWSTNIQEMPGAEHTGAIVEMHWKAGDRNRKALKKRREKYNPWYFVDWFQNCVTFCFPYI